MHYYSRAKLSIVHLPLIDQRIRNRRKRAFGRCIAEVCFCGASAINYVVSHTWRKTRLSMRTRLGTRLSLSRIRWICMSAISIPLSCTCVGSISTSEYYPFLFQNIITDASLLVLAWQSHRRCVGWSLHPRMCACSIPFMKLMLLLL